MAEPTHKSLVIESLIDPLNPSGRKRINSIKADICTMCEESATDFRDALSRKEYSISGTCQKCQDLVFSPDGDDD